MKKYFTLLLLILIGASHLMGQSKMEMAIFTNKQKISSASDYHLLNAAKATRSLGWRLAYPLSNRLDFELKGQYNKREFDNFYGCCCFGDCILVSEEFNPNYYHTSISLGAAVRFRLFQIQRLGFLEKIGFQGIQFFTALGLHQTHQIRDRREAYRNQSLYPAPGSPFQLALAGDLGLRLQLFRHFFLDGRINSNWLLKESSYYGGRFRKGPELALGYRW
ncbi:MAG: hypothetical protein AAFP19_19780 [Bacteroidota bacterium]